MRADSYHMTGGTGSLRYMAPEVSGHATAAATAAAWSVGAVVVFSIMNC